jgi:hypothetical protein
MTRPDPEIEELREKVHCAVVLERTPPPWKLDRKESTKLSLKYRRGKGEILIVSHAGRGWWDPLAASAARRGRGHYTVQLPRHGAHVDVPGRPRLRQLLYS